MFPSHRLTRNYFQSRAVHSSLKNSHTTRIECARHYYTHYEQNFPNFVQKWFNIWKIGKNVLFKFCLLELLYYTTWQKSNF